MKFPQPFFRKQTGTWYVQVGKHQISLGKDEKAARIKYHGIMAGKHELPPTTPAVVVLDQFLGWVSNNQAPAT